MAYRYDRTFTAPLLLAAAMAIGCSTDGGKRKAAPTPTHGATLVEPDKGIEDEEGAVGTATPATTGPVSFADGESAYHARKFKEAAQVFGRYTEQHPENAWGHFMLGLSTWKDGDLPRAEKAFEEALRIDPKHVKSLVNLSRVLLDEKRPDDAIVKLVQVSEIDPGSTEVHRLLGRAYHAQRKTDDAVKSYKRAIELDPNDSWAMNNLGLLYLEEGRAEDALPVLARAVELKKDVAAFHNNLGMALEQTRRFKAATSEYTEALSADPGYEKARRNLARTEQVKDSTQEPFDLEATARRFVEDLETWNTTTTASR
jgi:tetratricopeptide (TPR) repeat protein